jgi:choline dehydrogenase
VSSGLHCAPDGLDDVERFICERVWTYHHPVGTCTMGPHPEAGAVDDATGRVHGVDGMWVADASTMPDIPSANPHLATLMLAERIANWLANSASSSSHASLARTP